MSIETLVQYLNATEAPRCSGKVEHRLLDVLVIAVCAVIACAESWDDITLYGRSKLIWLRIFLDLPNGIPLHDTFRRVWRYCMDQQLNLEGLSSEFSKIRSA